MPCCRGGRPIDKNLDFFQCRILCTQQHLLGIWQSFTPKVNRQNKINNFFIAVGATSKNWNRSVLFITVIIFLCFLGVEFHLLIFDVRQVLNQ